MADCIYHHRWVFTVNSEGVKLIAEEGDPLPEQRRIFLQLVRHFN